MVSSLSGERVKSRKRAPIVIKGETQLRTLKGGARARVNRNLVPESWQRKTGKCGSMIESFYHAFHGIAVALKEQRNLRFHCVAAVCVVALAFYLRVDAAGWCALWLSCGFVIASELFNTAVEHMVDLSAEGQYRLQARKAKDTAAAAVLIASITAAIVGAIVFVPRLLAIFS